MPGECVFSCERVGAPVIRVTVFTFPLRRTGAQAARWGRWGSALRCTIARMYAGARLCVSVWGLRVLMGVLEEEEEEEGEWELVVGGVVRIIALQSFLDHPSGALMSQEGFGCCWFPLKTKGAGGKWGGIVLFPFSLYLDSTPPSLPPPQLKCLSIISSRSSTT